MISMSQLARQDKKICTNRTQRGMGLRNLDLFLNEPSQFELAAKTLQKDYASEVSEVGIDKGQIQFLQAFWQA